MVKTFIRDLAGESSKQVWELISTHPEWFGEVDAQAVVHCQFYGLYLENNNLAGFFAIADWGYGIEKVICYVYIFEEYRKQGLFNKIIKWVKNHCTTVTYITIGAKEENKLANEIYNRKFRWLRYAEEDKGNWYLVLDRSKK